MLDPHAHRADTGDEFLEQEVERNLLIQQAINAILRISLEPIHLDEQMHRILDLILELPWLALERKGAVYLADEEGKVLVRKAQVGMPAGALAACARVPFGTCLCGQAIASRQTVFANCLDARHSILYPGIVPHGHYCVPISSGQRPLGLLALYVREGHQRSATEERFLRAVADVLAGVIERQRAEQAVRESEARKAAVLETALDCIVTIDHEGRILEFNPAAEKTFGLGRAEVLGRPMAQLLVPPSLREQHHRGLARYLATGEGPILNRRVEMPALRAGGTEFPAELAVTRIATAGPPLFTAYLRDVTDRKRTERFRSARLALTQILAQAGSIEEAVPRILQTVCEELGWDVGAFWTPDPHAGVLRCAAHWHPPSAPGEMWGAVCRRQTFPPGAGLPGRIWGSGRAAWIADVAKDAAPSGCPMATPEGLHAALGCPVRLGGEVLGVLGFLSHEVREPDDDLLEMMAAIGDQIGQFVERRQSERRLAAEHAVSRILAVSSSLGEAAPAILRATCESLDWDVGILWVIDESAGVLRCVEVWHSPGAEVAAFEQDTRRHTYPPGVGLAGRVWAGGTLAWVPDLATEAGLPCAPLAAGAGLHGAVAFPVRNGVEFLGVMEFLSRGIRQPDDELIQMMTSIGSHISQFIERRQAEGELRKQEEDRRIARQIQQGLLPKAAPTFAGLRISGRSAPAQDVGGDCFDFFPLRSGGEECLGVLVADASGHGIGAALLVAQTRAYLRALTLACTDVGRLLTLSNLRLAGDLVTDHFVTLFLLRLDPRTRSLAYASAGHCPGCVLDCQGRTRAVLASTGCPLGIDPAGEFPDGTPIVLEPGELVLLFTDGIVEAASPDGSLFGLGRTLDLVRAHRQETPEAILDALFHAVGDFSGHRLHDDITAVIIKAEEIRT
jgi:PAS domain S-box-containing protein